MSCDSWIGKWGVSRAIWGGIRGWKLGGCQWGQSVGEGDDEGAAPGCEWASTRRGRDGERAGSEEGRATSRQMGILIHVAPCFQSLCVCVRRPPGRLGLPRFRHAVPGLDQ